MGAGAVEIPAARRVARIATRSDALAAAEALAARWRRDAVQRDRREGPDAAALEALRASGLLGIAVPADAGGLGATTGTIADVARILATGDSALAQQLQGHVGNVHLVAQGPASLRAVVLADVLDRGDRFGNTNTDRVPPDDGRPWSATVAVDGDEAVLTAEKAYATGASTADWLAVPATAADGATRIAVLRRTTDGVTVDGAWDAFGQRATLSGGARFDRVRLPAAWVLDPWRDPVAAEALLHRSQIVHPAIEVGLAEAVVAGPWPLAVRRRGAFARAAADVAAARALLDRAAAAIDALGAAPDALAVAEAGLALHAVKALAYRTSVRVADAATAWVGADDATRDRLDLLWRNARTHAVHDPGRWSFHHVGRHVLTGRFPASRLPGLRDHGPLAAPVVPPRLSGGAATEAVAGLGEDGPAGELRRAAADLSVARGAVRAAAAFVARPPRAWPEAAVERAADEPFAALRFGELAVTLEALDALVTSAAAALRDGKGTLAAAQARLQVDRWASRIVSDGLEIAGASALTRARGLDGAWRALLESRRTRPPGPDWAALAAAAAG